MSLSETQNFLKTHTLQEFEDLHGIRGKVLGPHLILDYDQISVKWTEPYGDFCRGLILDSQTFEPIAMGLRKFHNHGDFYCSPIDWESAVVFEKLDGTMVNRWWSPHTNQFEVSTRFQLPENIKANALDGGSVTWERLIGTCLATLDISDQPRNETWTFEVCSHYNMVVVRHDKPYAKLLARRNIETLQEISVQGDPRAAKSYRFSSAGEVTEFANQHPATELEGFVVCDSLFNRAKIKSDQYVALHRVKDGLKGINNLIDLAKGNDYQEILLHFPQYTDDLNAAAEIINSTITLHEAAYEKLKDIESQKDFAIAVSKEGLVFPAALFNIRAKKSPSIKAAFMNHRESSFRDLFKSRIKAVFGSKYTEE